MIEIELIVGTMGLDKVLADRLPKYSKSLLDKASTTLKDFKAGATEFATRNKPGSTPDETFGLKNFQDLSEKLLAEQELVDVVEGLASWPVDLQIEISVLVADIKAYLREQLPQSHVSGSFSGVFTEPSDSDQFRFLWQANLVDDVRRFSDLLNSGAITPVESAIMRTLFPQTHDYLLVEVMDKVLDAVVSGDSESWEGSWRKPALSGLLGVPVMNFSDVMGYQSGVEEKTAGRPKQAGSVQIANVNLTDNQKIDTKTVDQSK